MAQHRLPIVLCVVALLALAGCSSGGSEGLSPSTTRSRTATTAAGGGNESAGAPAADASEGCGTAPDVEPVGEARPGDVPLTFDTPDGERTYRLGVPADYDPDVPAPLLLNLHGSGSNALQASAYGDVPRRATARGFITIAPDAIDGKWQLQEQGEDLDFLIALTDDIEARYCIDRNREHIIGMSLGAWKAGLTACASDGRFASVALVTVEVFPKACDPLSVLAFHGRADPVVPYGDGGETDGATSRWPGLSGARDNIANWADSGGCDPEPQITQIGDDVELRRFDGCDPGVGVELYSIDGGGHTWPGADIDIAAPAMTTDTIDATALALDWFEAHPRPT